MEAVRDPREEEEGQQQKHQAAHDSMMGGKSPLLQRDPVMDLSHIIGYNTDAGLKWSKIGGEKTVIFSSGGMLISMDINTQK